VAARVTLALVALCALAVSPVTADPSIVAVRPNPVADGDAGEFVVVDAPVANLTLSDGETTVTLPPPNATLPAAPRPNATPQQPPQANATVAYTTDPAAARNTTDRPVVAVSGRLALANGGETLRLQTEGETVQTISYEDAPEGESFVDTDRGWTWRSPAATNFSIRTLDARRARTFVLPDAPGVALDALRSADRRILLAGYTFASPATADALIAAHERGVTVRVLVDGAPVGGVSTQQVRQLDRLAAAGIPVAVLAGERARYNFQHAKYAVVDQRAVVLTENWKPAGVGGRSSRGWGVVLGPPASGTSTADALATVFRADTGWQDTTPWRAYRSTAAADAEAAAPANETYPSRFSPRSVPVERVRLVLAPDNAERAVVDMLSSANETIRIEQPTLGSLNGSLVSAVLAAAERGVRVRILLDGAWYVAEDNRKLVDRLDALASRRDLPIEARVVAPRGRFEKIHAKGVVVDERRALVGSLNWNDNALHENREVAVLLEGEAAGAYYARVFDADWRGAWRVPVGLVGLAAVALLGVVFGLLRGLRFDG
jgi:phosphatidylserine/phosphatidylglycerophosphate/cardiolipin synthase-like enzyme